MTKTKVEPWQSINVRRTDSGWDFSLQNKDGSPGGLISHSFRGQTFDEVVAVIKDKFDVS